MKTAKQLFQYALLACVPVGASLAAHVWFGTWLAQEWTYHEDCCCGLHGTAIPLYHYLGGATSQAYSHWLDLWGCSGVFLGLLWLMAGERFIRGREEIALRGAWFAAAGPLFTLFNWGVLASLDHQHGARTFLFSCALCFAPLFALVFPAFHARHLRPGSDRRFYAESATLAAGMLAAQAFFEPSYTGAPNWLAWMLLASICFYLPVTRAAIMGKGFDPSERAAALDALRAKGFDWAQPSDAAFVLKQMSDVDAIAFHDAIAARPGYRDGDIRLVVLLSTFPQPMISATPSPVPRSAWPA